MINVYIRRPFQVGMFVHISEDDDYLFAFICFLEIALIMVMSLEYLIPACRNIFMVIDLMFI